MIRSIAILGAGAVGGYYGARLAQAGHNVHFLLRSDYAHVRAHGLTIESIDGDFSLSPSELHAYNRTTDMPQVDLIIVTLKSTDNPALPALIPPLLHESTAILTLQNGLGNEHFLARHFPHHAILGGIAFTCINRTGPGAIHHSDHGFIKLGAFRIPLSRQRERSDQLPHAIATLFADSKIPTTAIPDLISTRWNKLTWNIPFNGLGALLDLSTDRLLASPHGLSLVRALIAEVMSIADAEGHTLPNDLPEKQIALTRTMGPYISSTQLDRRRNRPMELESIFRRPLAIAQSHSLPSPHLAFLTQSLELLSTTPVTNPP